MNNFEIVKKASELLKENLEWDERYANYAKKIDLDQYARDRKKFRIPSPLNIYSSISRVEKCTKYTTSYDLRHQGQSIGEITVKNGEVYLNTKGKKESNSKYFKYYQTWDSDEVKWDSVNAKNFRKHFKSYVKSSSHSPEHKIEQFLLSEFSKRTRASGKKLCSIQPVRRRWN